MAATQAGLGALTFDPVSGTITDVGPGTGLAGFEPFLQQATGLADAGAQAALLGQGVGRRHRRGSWISWTRTNNAVYVTIPRTSY